MRTAVLLGAAVGLALVQPATAMAQGQPTTPPMLFVYNDYVAPANTAAYEAALKEGLGKVLAVPAGAKLDWIAASGSGNWYLYAFPMQSMGDMDRINRDWETAMAAAGGPAIFAKSDALVDHSGSSMVAFRPDMSYVPANPSKAEAEGTFRHWTYWYPLPGKAQELEAVAREFVAMYKANNMDNGWRVYQAITGPELPLYIVANSGMDPADYYATGARNDATLGDADNALFEKAFKLTRRVETRDGMMRPDLAAAAFKK
jgi:hypothetical protein